MIFVCFVLAAFGLELGYNFREAAGQLIPSFTSADSFAVLGLTLLKEPEDAGLTARGAFLKKTTRITLPPNTVSPFLPQFSNIFTLSILIQPYSPGCLLSLKLPREGLVNFCWTSTHFGLYSTKEIFSPLFKLPFSFYNEWSTIKLQLSPDASNSMLLLKIEMKSYEKDESFMKNFEYSEQVFQEVLIFSNFFGFVSGLYLSSSADLSYPELDDWPNFEDTENLCPDDCLDYCVKDEKFTCVSHEQICGFRIFDISQGLCYDPIANCLKQSSDRCLECEPDYSVSGSGLYCTQHKISKKYTCHVDCATCSGPSISNCLTCTDANATPNASGKCTCNTDFTQFGSNPMKCSYKFCDSSCSHCTGPDPDECIDCKSSHAYLNATNYCICKDGYYLNSSSNSICKTCDIDCATCDGGLDTDCIICADSNAAVDSTDSLCKCNDGYYANSSDPLTCAICDSNCKSCSGSQTNECTGCYNNLIVTADGYCGCETSFYLSSGVCKSCHQSCLTCSGSTEYDCLTCSDDNSFISPVSNKCECDSGYVLSDNSSYICVKCDASCTTCSGSTEYDCLACSDPNSAISDQGNCICLEGYSLSSDNLTCVQEKCPACDPGFYSQSCSCLECSENCSECTDYETCTACKDPEMLIVNNSCECPEDFISQNGLCFCPDHQYKSDKSCISCPKGCDECIGEENCLKASSGYYLDSEVAYPCHPTCLECNGPDSNNCTSCFPSQQHKNSSCLCLSSQYFHKNSCVSCGSNCKKCSSDGNCELCNSSYTLDSSLNCQKKSSEEDFIKVFNSIGSSFAFVSLGFAFLLGSFNNRPSIIWTTINTVQILCYVPLQNVKITKTLFNFFKILQPISIIPNIWNFLMLQQCDSSLVPPFYEYGYTCEYFILNTGEIFLAFLLSVTYFLLLLLLFCVCEGKVKQFLFLLVKKYKWNFFIRYWIESFVDIAIPCIITMNNVRFTQLSLSSSNLILNSTLGFIFFVLLCLSPILCYFFVKSSIYAFEMEDYSNVQCYSPVFSEFQYKKGLTYLVYIPYFFFRRLIFAVILYQLTNYPLAQIALNITHTLILFIYLVKYKPFIEKSSNIINISQELLVCVVFALSGFFILDMNEDQEKLIQDIIIALVCIVIGISYAYLAYSTIKLCVEYLKERKLRKEKKTAAVSPEIKHSKNNQLFIKNKPDVSMVEESKNSECDQELQIIKEDRRKGIYGQWESGEKSEMEMLAEIVDKFH